MGSRGSILEAGVSSLLLALALVALAVAEPLGVPEEVVVRRQHDARVLAYPLGSVDALLQVHAVTAEETRAHYYSLIAHRGQWLHVELCVWARPGRQPPRLHLSLLGPGLPPEGVAPADVSGSSGPRPLPMPAPREPERPSREVLAVRAPVRGRYVLMVRAEEPRAGAYRIRFRGRGSWRISALARYPLRRLEAAYLAWPERTLGWAFGAAGACCVLAGIGHFIRHRRIAARGGFVG